METYNNELKIDGVIIFDISNQVDQYIDCAICLDQVLGGSSGNQTSISKNLKRYYIPNSDMESLNISGIGHAFFNVYFEKIINKELIEIPITTKLRSDGDELQYQILFFVSCQDTELSNLAYFRLIQQQWEQIYIYMYPNRIQYKSELFIAGCTLDDSDLNRVNYWNKTYMNVSRYLQIVAKGDVRKKYFSKYIGATKKDPIIKEPYAGMGIYSQPLTSDHTYFLKRYYPLIDIGSNTIEWDRSVYHVCKRYRRSFPMILPPKLFETKKWLEEEYKIDNSEGYNKYKVEIKKQYNKGKLIQAKICDEEIEYAFIRLCVGYFCQRDAAEHNHMRDVATRHKVFFSDKFWKQIQNSSALAFYLACMLEYYCGNSGDDFDWDSFESRLIFVRDIADGLLQLIENVQQHTRKKQGSVTLCVHKANKNGEFQGIKDRCPEGYNRLLVNMFGEDMPYLLETQILDFSDTNVPEMFKHNVRERANEAPASDKEHYDELLGLEDCISLRSFFTANENEENYWRAFYKIGSNIIHHYGLHRFHSVVISNRGLFKVQSSSEYTLSDEQTFCKFNGMEEDDINCRLNSACRIHLRGTQFSTLFPLRWVPIEQKPSLLTKVVDHEVKLEYGGYQVFEGSSFREKDVKNEYNFLMQDETFINLPKHKQKERTIDHFSQKLWKIIENQDQIKDKTQIMFFSANDIDTGRIEYFCKALIYCLIKASEKGTALNVAVYNCESAHFIEIVRIITIFYDKKVKWDIMDKIQLYLSGENTTEEFLISGKNVATMINRARKLTFERNIGSRCLNLLEGQLSRYYDGNQSSDDEESTLDLVPFDILSCTYSEEPTVFEQGVKYVLENDILSQSFGCQLSDIHIRIGSKIHVDTYYETDLLFHNSYYSKRFAYLMVNKIDKFAKMGKLDLSKPMCLVGYEQSSEMMLYEMKEMLMRSLYKGNENSIGYFVYQESRLEHIDLAKESDNIETQFIIVVPTSTTMTTHNKIQAELINKYSKSEGAFKLSFAPVLIRDNEELDDNGKIKESSDMELSYWKISKDRSIETKDHLKLYGEVFCLVSVRRKWQDPEKCELCWPSDSPLKERPLASINWQSMQKKIGLTEKTPPIGRFVGAAELLDFKDAVKFGHLKRNENHYQYYIDTNKLLDNCIRNIDEFGVPHIRRYLKDKKITITKERRESNKKLCYDILVAPIHFSNGGFLEEVKKFVFPQSVCVMRFSIVQELRSNFQCKFSNITSLYNNLYNANTEAWINFHFIDDEIITGRGLMRAKNLIESLFPHPIKESIHVSIFEHVFVLINRHSHASVVGFVKDPEHQFHAYKQISVSSMRNHEGACYLCNLENYYREAESYVATNTFQQEFWLKRDKYKLMEVKNARHGNFNEMQSAFRRLCCAHIATENLIGYENKKLADVIEQMIPLLISPKPKSGEANVEKDEDFEYLLSYIKVLSRPFISDERIYNEAIFKILLYLLDRLLFGKRQNLDGVDDDIKVALIKLNVIIEKYSIGSKDDNTDYCTIVQCKTLFVTLINRLSSLGSNYLLKQDKIEMMIALSQNLGNLMKEKNEKEEKEEKEEDFTSAFTKLYTGAIKRILITSKESTKEIHFEETILTLLKSGNYRKDETNDSVWKDVLYEQLYLENNRTIKESVIDLKPASTEDEVRNKLKNYYFKSLNRIIEINKESVKTDKERILMAAVHFYISLETAVSGDLERNVHKYYKKLAQGVREVMDANSVYFLLDDTSCILARDIRNEGHVKDNELDLLPKDFKEIQNFKIYSDCQSVVLRFTNNHSSIKSRLKDSDKDNNIEIPPPMYTPDMFFFITMPDNKEPLEILFRIRFILAYRFEIVAMMEKHIINDSMVDYISMRERQQALLSERSFRHDAANKYRGDFLALIRDFSKNNTEEWAPETLGILLAQLADEQIVYYYRHLFQKDDENHETDNDASANLVGTKNLVGDISDGVVLKEMLLKNMQVVPKIISSSSKKSIICKWEFDNNSNWGNYQYYEFDRSLSYELMLLLLIRNAGRHSYLDSDTVTVEITLENEKLVLYNEWNKEIGEAEKACERLREWISRIESPKKNTNEGITLWTLNQLIKQQTRLRHKSNKEEGIEVDAVLRSKKTYFKVAIPIYEYGGEKE